MSTHDKVNEVTSTPRTDAEIARALQAHGKGGTTMVYKLNDMEAFARQLELDAATWRAKAKRWQEIADQRAIEVADLKVATPSAVAEQEPDTVQRRAREWDALHTTIREFVGDYYMPGDGGDYNPPPEIRAVICDAVHGLIGEEDFLNALVKVYSVRSRFAPSATRRRETHSLMDGEPYHNPFKETIVNVEQIARVAHEVNRAYCLALGDASQAAWEDAPQWQKDSAINGVKFHIAHPGAGPDHSHVEWLKEKEANGWKYGPVKDADKKEHPCFVPYDQLPVEQKAKDYLFRGVVHALAA